MPRAKQIALAAVMLILSLAVGEIALRLTGSDTIHIRSAGSARAKATHEHFIAHPKLGYALQPEKVQARMQVGSWIHNYHITIDERGRRITHPPRAPGAPARDQIWLVGCSWTFGALLDDEQSYPWIVQEMLPEYEIVNFGVGSYSPLQSLIQLEETLEQPLRPKAVVLLYNSFHDERNVFARRWKQNLLGGFRRPFVRFGPDGQLHRGMMDEDYDVLPLAQSSTLVASIDRVLSRLDQRRLRPAEVSRLVITDIFALCRREGIPFVIANQLGNVSYMLAEFRAQGATIVNTPFGRRNDLFFWPYDKHPNPAGARAIAEDVAPTLKQVVRH